MDLKAPDQLSCMLLECRFEGHFAQQCAVDEWSDFAPTMLPLADFLEAWLPGMAEDGVLVVINWNAQLIGVEASPEKLIEDLSPGSR